MQTSDPNLPESHLMRCLAVQQPWAWAICTGEKRTENRSWSTDYRGPIAIHASTSQSAVKEMLKRNPVPGMNANWFAYGAVIGVVDLVECVELNEGLEADVWASGPFCWLLENARLLDTSIPMKGKLNLFSLPAEVKEKIQQQLKQPEPANNISRNIQTAIQPVQQEMRFVQARSYCELGKWADAVRVATRAISANPNNAFGYQVRAIGLIESGQVEAGLADANQAIALEPTASGAFYSRSVAKNLLGDEHGMREDYERARELGADLPPLDEVSG